MNTEGVPGVPATGFGIADRPNRLRFKTRCYHTNRTLIAPLPVVTPCSSVIVVSIVISLHKPHLTIQLAINAIETGRPTVRFITRSNRHVPFVSRPAIFAPPIASRSPRTSHLNHFSINTSLFAPRTDLRGPPVLGLDHRAQRWTKHS